MCARFYLGDETEEANKINAQALRSPLSGKFAQAGGSVVTSGEVRPMDVVPVIAPNQKGEKASFPMKWGFCLPKGSLAINARTETAATKPTFQEAWARHRCAIPASWYYEWTHLAGKNGKAVAGDKYMIRPRGEAMTWLAGLYRMEDGLPHFTVLTREASEDIKFIHDRMPLIFPRDVVRDWISSDTNPEAILPYALSCMIAEKV